MPQRSSTLFGGRESPIDPSDREIDKNDRTSGREVWKLGQNIGREKVREK